MTREDWIDPVTGVPMVLATKGMMMHRDETEVLYQGLRSIANAITPFDASGNRDAAGGYVTSLTEAVMGNTKALVRVAEALENIAEAIRDGGGR